MSRKAEWKKDRPKFIEILERVEEQLSELKDVVLKDTKENLDRLEAIFRQKRLSEVKPKDDDKLEDS